ncbi:TolC family protein [Parabacteroides sp. Marseille-P3160]|uniref:TolC family protein n=1 Tax=Parabacteroides sp. Marseille-P3160 TaxID=1917887 RepID=UPI0009B9D1B8|nr:TolC family protein [Parabacteroides sp. Marseille-P3160]
MKMKLIFTLALMGGCFCPAGAQWTLDSCREKALANYPQVRQYDLIRKSSEYTLSNAGKAYLPQVSLSGKASYQTDVTRIPVDIPGVREMNKDQYGLTLDVSQSLWDGGVTHSKKKIEQASAYLSKQQLEVELYALNDRVNQLYFGILLLDAKREQNKLLQEELQRNYERVNSLFRNGMANAADLDAVRVEQLKAIQQETQLVSGRTAYVEMLAHLTGQQSTGEVTLVKPEEPLLTSDEIHRPELSFFEAQQQLLNIQRESVKVGYMPKFGLFITGGYGRPGLNMLDRDFSPYAIGGIRLSWNFGSLYTSKNERRLIETSLQNTWVQRETFLFNTEMELSRQQQEIRKNKDLLEYDDEIIRLRENVKRSAEAKVANGMMTITDWMEKVTDESLARQEKIQHEMEYLLSMYNKKYTTNN